MSSFVFVIIYILYMARKQRGLFSKFLGELKSKLWIYGGIVLFVEGWYFVRKNYLEPRLTIRAIPN